MIFANHAHVFPKEIRPEGSVESLLRFMDECGIDKAVAFAPFDDRFHEQFYMYGHMNPSGYILIAEMVDSYIDYIVRHNPKDFESVGFINRKTVDWESFV